MKHIESSDKHLIILRRGEGLFSQLKKFAEDNFLTSAWLSGLGGAECVTLGFYDIETKSYKWEKFSEHLEIVSLTGNLSIVDDKPFWHIHGVFSRSDYSTIAGHVKTLVVGLTGEIIVMPLTFNLTRLNDDETGLKLLGES